MPAGSCNRLWRRVGRGLRARGRETGTRECLRRPAQGVGDRLCRHGDEYQELWLRAAVPRRLHQGYDPAVHGGPRRGMGRHRHHQHGAVSPRDTGVSGRWYGGHVRSRAFLRARFHRSRPGLLGGPMAYELPGTLWRRAGSAIRSWLRVCRPRRNRAGTCGRGPDRREIYGSARKYRRLPGLVRGAVIVAKSLEARCQRLPEPLPGAGQEVGDAYRRPAFLESAAGASSLALRQAPRNFCRYWAGGRSYQDLNAVVNELRLE